MLGVAHWGRQIKFLLGMPSSQRYTSEQVHWFLRRQAGVEVDAEVEQMVARLPTILSDSRIRRRYDGFQRYVEVLPRIIFLYHQGMSTEAITESLSFVATEVGVDMVIWITCQVVSEQLNRLP